MKPISCAIAVLIAGVAWAEPVTWTGGGSNNRWNTAENWSTGRVPGPDDVVTVPSGTPSPMIPWYFKVDVQFIENYNTITTDGDVLIKTSGSFKNYGEVRAPDSGSVTLNTDDFENQGGIQGGALKVVCGTFLNGTDAQMSTSDDRGGMQIWTRGDAENKGLMYTGESYEPGHATGDLEMHCSDDFTNSGTMFAGTAVGGGEGGSNVIICTGTADNSGTIAGGSSNGGPGGSATVIAIQGSVNTGRVLEGSGNTSGKAAVCANEGGVSNEGTIGTKPSRQEPGDVLVAGPMVYILESDSAEINSRNLVVVADRIMLGTVGAGPKVSATADNRFYLTGAGGYVTMEELDTAGVFAGGGNYVFADSIQPPPMGYALAFVPDPVIAPTDTGRRNALVIGLGGIDSAGASGTLAGKVMNLSTSARAVGYSITSSLGWVATASGTTGPLNPFALESLAVAYSIPHGARHDTRDTVRAVLSIPTGFVDTAVFYLVCYRDTFPPGIAESPRPVTGGLDLRVVPGIVRGACRIQARPCCGVAIRDALGRTVALLRTDRQGVAEWQPRGLCSGVYFACAVDGMAGATRGFTLVR